MVAPSGHELHLVEPTCGWYWPCWQLLHWSEGLEIVPKARRGHGDDPIYRGRAPRERHEDQDGWYRHVRLYKLCFIVATTCQMNQKKKGAYSYKQRAPRNDE